MNKKNLLAMAMWMIFCSTSLLAQNRLEIVRAGKADVKISLNAYSFTKPLLDFAKGRGTGQGMSMFEFMDWAAEQGFDAVDLTAYFFPGYPAVPSDEYINDLKRHAFELGLDISGTGVRNDFADPDPAVRAAGVKHVKEFIDVAVKLGAPVIRVFSGPIPVGYENKWDEIAKYMAESLKECAEYGKLRGVLVGVQNHGDFLKTADQTIKLVKMVNSEWFGIIVDTGYFITEDPYSDIEKAMPYAVNFQLKESVFGAASPVKIDLQRIMEIVKRTGYRGYMPIETLSPLGGNKKKKDVTTVLAGTNGSTAISGATEITGKAGKGRKGGKAASAGAGTKSANAAANPTTGSDVKAARPAYDPYTVVPAFFQKVKEAQKMAFNQ